MLRIINALLISMMLTFGVVFGVTVHNASVAVSNRNAQAQEQINQQVQDYNRALSDDIQITQQNKNANRNESTSSSHGGGSAEEVPTGSFKELYAYAVNKLNRATYVYATSTGRINLIEGKAVGQVIKDESLSFSTILSKSQNERYFQAHIIGNKILGFDVNLLNIHYADGTTAKMLMPTGNVRQYSYDEYQELLDWNIVSPFHLPNASSVNNLTDNEIVSFIYNEARKEYVSQISINIENYEQSNFGAILKTITGAASYPEYVSLNITIIIDENGTLKSITYNEHIDTTMTIDVGGQPFKISANVRLRNHTINYDIIDNGFVSINKPTWA